MQSRVRSSMLGTRSMKQSKHGAKRQWQAGEQWNLYPKEAWRGLNCRYAAADVFGCMLAVYHALPKSVQLNANI